MSKLPFAVSDEAVSWIEKVFHEADRIPECAEMRPALCKSLSHQSTDKEGRITERFKGQSFFIGWYRPESMIGYEFTELMLADRKVWVVASTLAELTGKRLVLETVDAGVPRPADKKLQMLRAV